MKKFAHIICLLLAINALLVLIPNIMVTAGSSIDTSQAAHGYFSVSYDDGSGAAMKVGITYGGITSYHNYVQGTTSQYAFERGDGIYTIALYRHLADTSYQQMDSQTVTVKMASSYEEYLVSTSEVSFASGDAVSQAASQLCLNKPTTELKVVALHNNMAANYRYDQTLANQITSGQITTYTPSATSTLASKKGICYDLSVLFAALCRSQDIPCAVIKGTLNGASHAWNGVSVDGVWYLIDMTYAVQNKDKNAKTIQQCSSPLEGYKSTSSGIPLAPAPRLFI